MAAITIITTQFFAVVIFAAQCGLITTQAARLATRLVARRLERHDGLAARQLGGTMA